MFSTPFIEYLHNKHIPSLSKRCPLFTYHLKSQPVQRQCLLRFLIQTPSSQVVAGYFTSHPSCLPAQQVYAIACEVYQRAKLAPQEEKVLREQKRHQI